MKQFRQFVIISFLLFAVVDACMAFTELQMKRFDSTVLRALKGYKSYQWQVSSDGVAYLNIPSALNDSFALKCYIPSYYRVLGSKEDGSKVSLDTFKIKFDEITYFNNGWFLPASHGYVEVNGSPGSGITIPSGTLISSATLYKRGGKTVNTDDVLTNWNNSKAHAVWYAHQEAGIYDTKLVLTVMKSCNVLFRLRVYNPNSPTVPIAESYIALNGTGQEETIDAISTRITKSLYYRYDLECIQGNNYIYNIKAWHYLSASDVEVYTPAYLSGPSTHLWWSSTNTSAPNSSGCDWCYEEVMIPDYSDIYATYCMAIGFSGGYMGIQNNGTNRHDVIFSIWDNGSTEKDPGLANYKKAGAVDAGPNIQVNRFGNEGTGAQTLAAGDYWTPGKFVQFISNARPETMTYTVKSSKGEDSSFVQKNTLMSTWFNLRDGKGWQYMATVRMPGQGQYFDGWYSFLENYNAGGDMLRRAYYKNCYGHSVSSNKWFHFNKAGFTHTDGGGDVGARSDYGQGRDNQDANSFVMQNGSFINCVQNVNNVALRTDNTPVDTVKLDLLNARIDEAVKKETDLQKQAAMIAKDSYIKTTWKVIHYSSQETIGEGTNGRAAEIIDGDETTYWHSAWQSGTATFPHEIVVDMQNKQKVNGFQFILSGGTERHMKGVEIYASDNNVAWHKIFNTDAAPDAEKYYLALDSVVAMRYFKIVVLYGWTDQVHTRINEVNVTHPDQADGILNVVDKNSKKLTVCMNSITNSMDVVVPENAQNMKVEVASTDGTRLLKKNFTMKNANELVRIPLKNMLPNIYVVRCTIGNHVYIQTVSMK